MDEEQLAMVDELLAEDDFADVEENAERAEQAPYEAEDAYSQKAISVKFGDLSRQEFSRWVFDRIDRAVNARKNGGFDDRVREGRLQYDGWLPEKDEPYEGSSNFNVPLSQPIADTLHANFMATFFSPKKWFIGDAPTKDMAEEAEAKEDSLQYILEKKLEFRTAADTLIHRAIVDKSTVARVYWHKSFTKKRVLEMTPEGKSVERTQMVLEKNDACVEPISVLDFGFYPADALSQKARIIEFHRTWVSKDDLMKGATAGFFDRAAVEALTETPSQADRHEEERGGNESDIEASGITVHDLVSDEDKPYEMFDSLVKFDIDGDGMDEMLIVNIVSQPCSSASGYDSGPATLLRAVLYPYEHGESWYTQISPFLDPDKPYPPSLMERLEDVQDEVNAIQNMRTDRAIIENNAPTVVHSSLKRDLGKKKLAPGMVFFSESPKDSIFAASMGTGNQRQPEEVRFTMSLGQDIAGVNETVMGRTSGDATARDVERSTQGVNIKFDDQATRIAKAFQRIAFQVACLYAQYQSSELEYAVQVEPKKWDWRTITPEQMKTKMGFTMAASSSMANPEYKAYIAEKMVMLSERSPLISQRMDRIYEVDRYWLENAAGIRDVERYIGTKDEAVQQQQAADQAAGQKESKISITERRDEVLSLARAIKDQEISIPEYYAAAKVAAEAKKILGPVPDGAKYGDATDNSAGYEEGAGEA